MLSRRIIPAAGLTVAALLLLWLPTLPLGVPGEWVWGRIPVASLDPLWLLIAAVSGVLYVLGAVFVARRMGANPDEPAGRWLAALVLAGFVWLTVVQSIFTDPNSLAKGPWVLYYPSSSGYFHYMRHEQPDAGKLLATYEPLMAEGDVLHVGTHPPGLFLLYSGLLEFYAAFPQAVPLVRATEPPIVVSAFEILRENNAASGIVLDDRDAAVLWTAVLLTQLLAVLTVLPLYGLVRSLRDRVTAWKVAVFWPLVPAVAIFLPKSDALYAMPAMLLLYLITDAGVRPASWRWFAAGLALFAGMFCSLAFVPVAAAAAGIVVVRAWRNRNLGQSSDVKRTVRGIVYAAAGFGLPCIILEVAGIPIFKIWLWNYSNHAGFYDQFPRSYFLWLGVNLFELLMALGPPILLAAVIGATRTIRDRSCSASEFAVTVACAGTWMLLWLTGKNMGEAARLWLFLMPWFVGISSAAWNGTESQAARPTARGHDAWPALLALQAAYCLLTVAKVSGFDFV